jgi:hypothetical protein
MIFLINKKSEMNREEVIHTREREMKNRKKREKC